MILVCNALALYRAARPKVPDSAESLSNQGDELTGTTLKVYRDILRAGTPIRLSEIQRDLGLSSASLVQYHVKKLMEMGLVREEGTGYVVEKVVVEKVVVESVFRIRRMLVPSEIAFVFFFTVALVAMVASLEIQGSPRITSFVFIALTTTITALSVSVYRVLVTMKRLS